MKNEQTPKTPPQLTQEEINLGSLNPSEIVDTFKSFLVQTKQNSAEDEILRKNLKKGLAELKKKRLSKE